MSKTFIRGLAVVAVAVTMLSGCAQAAPAKSAHPTGTGTPKVSTQVVATPLGMYNEGTLPVVLKAADVAWVTGDGATVSDAKAQSAYLWAASFATFATTYSNFATRSQDLTLEDFKRFTVLGDEAGSIKMTQTAQAFLDLHNQKALHVVNNATWMTPFFVLPGEDKYGKDGVTVDSYSNDAQVVSAGANGDRNLIEVAFDVTYSVKFQAAESGTKWMITKPVRHFDLVLEDSGGTDSPFLLHGWNGITTTTQDAVPAVGYSE